MFSVRYTYPSQKLRFRESPPRDKWSRMNSRRTVRPKRIERSREIYKAIAADAAACGMTPKQFAELFMEQGVRELRKLSWISRRAAR